MADRLLFEFIILSIKFFFNTLSNILLWNRSQLAHMKREKQKQQQQQKGRLTFNNLYRYQFYERFHKYLFMKRKES